MSDSNSLENKVSTHIQTQLPEFIQADHPVFTQFLKLYYQFLESAEITFSEVNNYLVQETATVNFVLDENGDNIVLEDSKAKFTAGETITGQTSGATAKVLVDDIDNNKRLFVTSNTRFILGEMVSGDTSNSSGTIETYRPNPVSSIQQLLNYSNVDSTLYEFLDKFRDSFLEGIVDNLNSSVDKRKLIKNIRDLYIAKGTKKGHELFFRLLLNETPQITYPNEEMLRVSDGVWSRQKILRASPSKGLASELLEQNITGLTSNAKSTIITIATLREDGKDVVEIQIDEDLTSGVFVDGETIRGISTVTGDNVDLIVRKIISSTEVSSSGSYYTKSQQVKFDDGNSSAIVTVGDIGTGSIDEIIIDDSGQGYEIGDMILINNTGTDGKNFSAEVQLVGGAIAPESGTPDMDDNDHILMEDGSQSFYQDSYEGTKIVLETATHGNAPGSNANERGEITDIRIINRGNGYTSLPLLDKSNNYNTSGVLDETGQVYSTGVLTTSGSGAKLIPVSNSGVGSILSFDVSNAGFDLTNEIKLEDGLGSIIDESSTTVETTFLVTEESALPLQPFRNAILKDITGSWTVGNSVTFQRLSSGSYGSLSGTGTITSYDSARQLLVLNTDVDLIVTDKVISSSTNGIIANISIGKGTTSIGTLTDTIGSFVTTEGLLSEEFVKIQDSYYYQDFSYVIKVGESISSWRDQLKSSVHPAGWIVFGEIAITNTVSAKVQPFTEAQFGFSPELASILDGLLLATFGRRLGTTDDGTTLRANSTFEASDSAITSGTRDTTLTRHHRVIVGDVITSDKRLVTGPTLDLLPKYAFAVPPIPTNVATNEYPGLIRTARSNANDYAYFNIGQFANIKINEVCASDGSIPEQASRTRINVPPPGEVQVST